MELQDRGGLLRHRNDQQCRLCRRWSHTMSESATKCFLFFSFHRIFIKYCESIPNCLTVIYRQGEFLGILQRVAAFSGISPWLTMSENGLSNSPIDYNNLYTFHAAVDSMEDLHAGTNYKKIYTKNSSARFLRDRDSILNMFFFFFFCSVYKRVLPYDWTPFIHRICETRCENLMTFFFSSFEYNFLHWDYCPDIIIVSW